MAEQHQPDEISPDERRQFDRARLIVDVHFDGADSTGGLYLSTQLNIPEGSTLTLRIPLGSEHLIVKGDVVYSNPGHGVGVRFHRLSEDDRIIMQRELPQP